MLRHFEVKAAVYAVCLTWGVVGQGLDCALLSGSSGLLCHIISYPNPNPHPHRNPTRRFSNYRQEDVKQVANKQLEEELAEVSTTHGDYLLQY